MNYVEGFLIIQCDDHGIFFFHFVYMVDHIDRIYDKTSLNLWYESYLIIMDDFLECVLGFSLTVFYDYCIHVHEADWFVILFLCCVFAWFWCLNDCSLIKSVWQFSFLMWDSPLYVVNVFCFFWFNWWSWFVLQSWQIRVRWEFEAEIQEKVSGMR